MVNDAMPVTDFLLAPASNATLLVLAALLIIGTVMLANLRSILANLATLLDAALADSANLRAERDSAVARVTELEAALAGIPEIEALANELVTKLQPAA